MTKSYLLLVVCTLALFAGAVNWAPAKDERPVLKGKITIGDRYVLRDGEKEAEDLLHQGRMVIVAYGRPVQWTPDYRRILHSQYQVEYRTVAGCVVSNGIHHYARKFNAVMYPAIEAQFGPNIFRTVATEAQTLYRQRTATQSE
jgi:hypothetical protein